MKNTLYCIIVFSLLFSFVSKAGIYQKDTDTLQGKSYDELEELFYNNQKDRNLGSLYASSFLKKAKKEANTIKIADGYNLLSIVNPIEIGIEYMDRIYG